VPTAVKAGVKALESLSKQEISISLLVLFSGSAPSLNVCCFLFSSNSALCRGVYCLQKAERVPMPETEVIIVVYSPHSLFQTQYKWQDVSLKASPMSEPE
jgi:hypothetical protein